MMRRPELILIREMREVLQRLADAQRGRADVSGLEQLVARADKVLERRTRRYVNAPGPGGGPLDG